MATITLNGTSFNYSMGMSAFNGLGSAFSSLKRTTNELNSALNSLESKVNIGSIATITKTSQKNVQKTQKRELTKNKFLNHCL